MKILLFTISLIVITTMSCVNNDYEIKQKASFEETTITRMHAYDIFEDSPPLIWPEYIDTSGYLLTTTVVYRKNWYDVDGLGLPIYKVEDWVNEENYKEIKCLRHDEAKIFIDNLIQAKKEKEQFEKEINNFNCK